MIKIKSNRLSRNQPISYVGGYPTAERAKDDISRLDQLLELSPKRKRKQPPNQTQGEPAFKFLSGLPFIRLRRKLNWKYYMYKKDLLRLPESVTLLSKEARLRKQEDETQHIKDFLNLEQGFKSEKALAYIHQRLRVLNARKR
jgi:hypothetical protein